MVPKKGFAWWMKTGTIKIIKWPWKNGDNDDKPLDLGYPVIHVSDFPWNKLSIGYLHDHGNPQPMIQCEAPRCDVNVDLDSPQELVRYKYHKP